MSLQDKNTVLCVPISTWLKPMIPSRAHDWVRRHKSYKNAKFHPHSIEKNIYILLSDHQWCFAAPGLEASERLFPGHRAPGPSRLKTSASSVEDGSWSSLSGIQHGQKETKRILRSWHPLADQLAYVMQRWLCADHLKVLLGQALEFIFKLLDSLSQVIVPPTQ